MRSNRTAASNAVPQFCLAVLFALCMISQVPFTVDAVRSWTGDYPDLPAELGSPWPTVLAVNFPYRNTGLKAGDRVVSVDGRALANAREAARIIREKRRGDRILIAVLRKGQPLNFQFRLAGLFPDRGQIAITLLTMPWICLLLGFWVAAARPRDKLAWLMLGILVGLSQLERPTHLDALGWPALIGVSTEAFRIVAQHGWAICMMLFAFYFPKRGRMDARMPWLKWLMLVPLGAMGLWGGVREAWFAIDYVSAERLMPREPWPHWLQMALLYSCISLFFAGIGEKYGDDSLARDDRRRLRLLYWGCTLSMLPSALLLIFYGLVYHRQPSDTPAGLWADMALVLFPITLAYVIVVQRAMDVRMVVRQGMQYALAQRGVLVIQLLLMAGVAYLGLNYAQTHRLETWQQGLLISAGVIAIVQVRARSEGVRRWVDRRFFREAYNADRILSELSEQVRGILDRDALLETVARKISESLHVDRVAVLLQAGGLFRPALALGYADGAALAIDAGYAPLQQLRSTREPVPVDPAAGGPLDAELLLPLASRKELLGFISLGPKRSEEPYSFTDTNLLKTVAAQAGLALENSMLSEEIASEVARREILSREIEIAREVQQRLFPQNLPPVAGLDYAGHCRPASGVGGDYYDFLGLPGGCLGIVIADVSGKGVPAALLMASLQASTRGQSQAQAGKVAELTANVNLLVCDASPENRYATFFYGHIDPVTRLLTYTNGGHNAPILLRGGAVMRLDEGGPPVGLFRFSQYVQQEVQLQAGDLLVLYTDGISEAENPAEEEWGDDALIAAARACVEVPAVETIDRLMAEADGFAAGAPQHDDMTLVIARVL
jgi:phosphoserine phosphatase RsbU/P